MLSVNKPRFASKLKVTQIDLKVMENVNKNMFTLFERIRDEFEGFTGRWR